jgi:U3 small nucleolar RNA-associated protein 24
MGSAKKTRKFGAVKRIIGSRDARLKKNQEGELERKKKEASQRAQVVREVPQVSSSLFFQYNTALVPPYSVLVDTNFLSHTVQRKLPLLETMMDALLAKATPVITSCVMSELEKLGPRYRIALRIARDERWERLACDHPGTYADDCIVDRIQKHKIYIVATNDRDLKRRSKHSPLSPTFLRRMILIQSSKEGSRSTNTFRRQGEICN